MLTLVSMNEDGAGRMVTHVPDDGPVGRLATAEVIACVVGAGAGAEGGGAEGAGAEGAGVDAALGAASDDAAGAVGDPDADPRAAASAALTSSGVSELASPGGEVRPFRKGDLVVYPAHGIGTVDQVRVEEIGGQKLNWIKISFAENRMSLRVPVRKAKDIGLRRPVSRQAFAEVLAILRGRPHASRLVWTKRALEYQGKINSGCVKALAEVVRDLRPSLDGSESSFSRRNLFESAVDRLAAEFAVVFRTDKAAAMGRLMAVPPVG